MTALLGAVFIASLLGSMHCAGMCGAFLAFAVSPPGVQPLAGRWRLIAAYNSGRLATYLALGAISGAVGAAVDLGGAAAGVQRIAAALAGTLMAAFGLVAILRLRSLRIPRLPVPRPLVRLAQRGHAAAAPWPPLTRSLATGLLTTLLPCGWLYAFAVTAAGTGDPTRGAATMAVFWAGTLPVMAGLGVAAQRATGALRKHLPMATSVLLVVVGLGTLFSRVGGPAMAGSMAPAAEPREEGARLRAVDHADLPCCADHDR